MTIYLISINVKKYEEQIDHLKEIHQGGGKLNKLGNENFN